MTLQASDLARRVLEDVEAFRPPLPHPDQMGTPLPAEWFETGIAEMRAALVPPYPLEVMDYDSQAPAVLARTVWIVADDGDISLVAYAPTPAGDFALVWRLENGPALSNIRGDAVGCFLAR